MEQKDVSAAKKNNHGGSLHTVDPSQPADCVSPHPPEPSFFLLIEKRYLLKWPVSSSTSWPNVHVKEQNTMMDSNAGKAEEKKAGEYNSFY